MGPCNVSADDMPPSSAAGEVVPAYIPGKEGLVMPTLLSEFSGERVMAATAGEGGRRKICSGQKLPRFIKTVLFETALAKKLRSRKSRPKRSSSALSSKVERVIKSMSEKPIIQDPSDSYVDQAVSDPRPPPSCSERTCATNFNLFGQSKNRDQRDEAVRRRCGSSMPVGLYLLLLILLLVIFLGKICAIVCASTWLLVVPRIGKVSPGKGGGEASAAEHTVEGPNIEDGGPPLKSD